MELRVSGRVAMVVPWFPTQPEKPMKLRRLTFAGAALLLCGPLPSAAQGECRIRVLALKPGAPESIQIKEDDGKSIVAEVPVKSYLNHEFETLKFTGNRLLFTSPEDPAAVLGRCEIPAKAKSLILLFNPVTTDPVTFNVVAVDDQAKAFPAGSFQVINLCPEPIRIVLETEPFEFKPGEARVIGDPPVNEARSSAMRASFQRDGKWQAFASGIWPHPGGKRVLQVITTNPASGHLELRGVRDVATP
jgi:hypothetical protein